MVDRYLQRLLGDGEKVLLVTRRHWIVLVEEVIGEVLISLVAIAVITIIWALNATESAIGLGYLVLIFPAISAIRDILVWSRHKYVVTNLRVIQLQGIINKNVIDSSLEKVNDVRMVQSYLGRLFNYGDLEILTASELGVNRFTRIGDPVRFKTAMLNAKVRLDQGEGHLRQALPASPDIPALIRRLGDLRDQGLLSESEFQEQKTKLLAQI